MSSARFIRGGLLVLSLSAGAMALMGQETTVWQIGKFDHTAAEFAGSAARPVPVDADAPDAARRWPASQAGTRNAASLQQPHSREIHFRLREAPAGAHFFDFALLAGNPRVPRLELDLNGIAASALIAPILSLPGGL